MSLDRKGFVNYNLTIYENLLYRPCITSMHGGQRRKALVSFFGNPESVGRCWYPLELLGYCLGDPQEGVAIWL